MEVCEDGFSWILALKGERREEAQDGKREERLRKTHLDFIHQRDSETPTTSALVC